MSQLSTTFGGWRDRLTYLLAEAQILVAGVLVSAGIALVWFRPELPGIPAIVYGWFAATLLLGPPLFGFFVWLIHKLRQRNMIAVHHINARTDTAEKYYVEPSIWDDKSVDGPNPYPINGGAAWAVQEFDYTEDIDELTVRGVWLEEVQDTKLLTSKSHMESIYEKLTESHIALQIFRDSVSEFGADIQRRLTNRMAEARERGKLMDKSAVKDVFEDFEDDATGVGPDDLPTLEPDDPLGDLDHDLVDDPGEEIGPSPTADSDQQPAATDGGEPQ